MLPIDVDSDGDVDLIRERLDEVYLNDGAGRFTVTRSVSGIPPGLRNGVAADFDGDGYADLYFSGRMLRQAAPRAFVDRTAASFPMGFPVGVRQLAVDVDGDGAVDIVGFDGPHESLALWYAGPSIAFNDGNGTFATPIDLGTTSVACAVRDFDGDQLLDVLSSDWTGAALELHLRRNLGNRTFGPPEFVGPGALEFHAADVVSAHSVGAVDLLVDSPVPENRRIHTNRGDGTFETIAAPFLDGSIPGGRLAALDVDGDGASELVVGGLATVTSQQLLAGIVIPGVSTMAGVVGPDVASVPVDVDGDGDEDLLLGSTLLINASDATMRVASPIPPAPPRIDQRRLTAELFGDVDGDGFVDAVTSAIHINRLDGAWQSVASDSERSYLALADLDGDGVVDTLCRDHSTGSLCVLLGDGGGGLQPAPAGFLPAGVTVSPYAKLAPFDVDADGDPDIVIADVRSVGWMESTSSGFGPLVELTVRSFHWPLHRPQFSDVDGDGLRDIVASGLLLMNRGAGFVDETSGRLPSGITHAELAADFDRDGDQDLVGSLGSFGYRVALNDGAGHFTLGAVVPVDLARGSAVDLDLDGDLDLASFTTFGLNDGTGNFVQVDGIAPQSGGAFADLDRDGDVDAVVDGRTIENLRRQVRAPFVPTRGRIYRVDIHAQAMANTLIRVVVPVIGFTSAALDFGSSGTWQLSPATSVPLSGIVMHYAENVVSAAVSVPLGMPTGQPFLVQAMIYDIGSNTLEFTNALRERVD
ncbi:MAG: VCBS repeat-containing protein [Planctomycetes bacterium]|nr:VCBS repeat-containing protein [Planctomycetota bacterium]